MFRGAAGGRARGRPGAGNGSGQALVAVCAQVNSPAGIWGQAVRTVRGTIQDGVGSSSDINVPPDTFIEPVRAVKGISMVTCQARPR